MSEGLFGNFEAIGWIERLSQAARDELERCLRISTVRRERTIYYQEDPAVDAYLVLEGTVRRLKWTDSGTTVLLGGTGPGEWFGLAEAFVRGVYLCDATTDCESTLAALHTSDLLRLLHHDSLRREVVHALAVGYYALHGIIEAYSPAAKIAMFLDTLVANETKSGVAMGSVESVEITQEAIARAVGLTRETVNRHLQELAASKVVALGRGQIRILDRRRLRGLTSTVSIDANDL